MLLCLRLGRGLATILVAAPIGYFLCGPGLILQEVVSLILLPETQRIYILTRGQGLGGSTNDTT